jgi:hypothetical protein
MKIGKVSKLGTFDILEEDKPDDKYEICYDY